MVTADVLKFMTLQLHFFNIWQHCFEIYDPSIAFFQYLAKLKCETRLSLILITHTTNNNTHVCLLYLNVHIYMVTVIGSLISCIYSMSVKDFANK